MRLTRREGQPRPGFTLVEMLVVIAIIVVLLSLSAAAYFYWAGAQARRNTEANIRTVYKVAQSQYAWVVDQAKKEAPSAAVKALANNSPLSSDDPTGERARILWIKVRLMEAFPASYSEVNNNGSGTDPVFNFLYVNAGGTGLPAIPAGQRKYLNAYQRTLGNGALTQANNPASESSACLLMALSVSRGGSVLNPDQLGTSVQDSDADGVKEIVDGWRMPLAFYRFAWGGSPLLGAGQGIQGLNPAPSGSKTSLLADPLDPAGLLLSWPNNAVTNYRNTYQALFHAINNTPTSANYVIPVLVSGGPDRALGLPPPSQCANTSLLDNSGVSASLDDIFSYNLTGN